MTEIEIPYEDEHLLVVDKPAGLVVHPAASHRGRTLVDVLGEQRGPWPGAPTGAAGNSWRDGLVHRLDKDTSGLMVVAKSERVRRKLQKLVRSRELLREYVALVAGRLGSRRGMIDAPVGRDVRDRTRISVTTSKPREARTHFEVEEWLTDTTLVRVRLETGRTHQIRVHFAAIGHPVIGDPRYGREPAYGLERQFLHAARLAFRHPETGGEIDLRSDLPADLEAVRASLA